MQANCARCEEVLLQPRLIFQCDGDIREDLCANVVLSGSTTIFQAIFGCTTNEQTAPSSRLAPNASVARKCYSSQVSSTSVTVTSVRICAPTSCSQVARPFSEGSLQPRWRPTCSQTDSRQTFPFQYTTRGGRPLIQRPVGLLTALEEIWCGTSPARPQHPILGLRFSSLGSHFWVCV